MNKGQFTLMHGEVVVYFSKVSLQMIRCSRVDRVA